MIDHVKARLIKDAPSGCLRLNQHSVADHVAAFIFTNEAFAVAVNNDEAAALMQRYAVRTSRRAAGVALDEVHSGQIRPDINHQRQQVTCCSRMICGREVCETRIMQRPHLLIRAESAGRHHYGFSRANRDELAAFFILHAKNLALKRSLTNDAYDSSLFLNRNAVFLALVHQNLDVVLSKRTERRMSARIKRPVDLIDLVFKLHAYRFEPSHRFRRILDEFLHQSRIGTIVTALERLLIMILDGIFNALGFLTCRIDSIHAAAGNGRIAADISHLFKNERVCETVLRSGHGSRQPSAAGTHDKELYRAVPLFGNIVRKARILGSVCGRPRSGGSPCGDEQFPAR